MTDRLSRHTASTLALYLSNVYRCSSYLAEDVVSLTNTSRFTPCREVSRVNCRGQTKYIKTLWERCRVLNVKSVGTYTYHCAFKNDACLMRIIFKAQWMSLFVCKDVHAFSVGSHLVCEQADCFLLFVCRRPPGTRKLHFTIFGTNVLNVVK